jgi:hypothetical protein
MVIRRVRIYFFIVLYYAYRITKHYDINNIITSNMFVIMMRIIIKHK